MKYATIGGQAVIEGIMMRNGEDYAVAVRKPNHEIEVKKDNYRGLVAKLHLKKVPIIRGVFAFIDSLVLGLSTLTYSAGFYDDEEEEDKTEGGAAQAQSAGKAESGAAAKGTGKGESGAAQAKDADKGESGGAQAQSAGKAESDNEDSWVNKLMMGATVVIAVVLALAIFMVLPFLVSNLFRRLTDSDVILSLLEGIVRIAIFMAYIVLISRMKDIQRTFMYHGAEHKTINCIEHGEELTPQNAMKYSRFHKRCGTSFLLIVVLLCVVVHMLFFTFVPVEGTVAKIAIRIALVPVIAGLSYEILQWAGNHESKLVDIVSKPGFLMQKLTTREPDEGMLEVAIAAIESIYDWRKFQREAGVS